MSADEIKRNAVCTINVHTSSGSDSVYDERMGVIENGKQCVSCGRTNKACSGHYGCIKLARPIFHPMYLRYICMFLNMVCKKCSRLVVTMEHVRMDAVQRTLESVHEYVKTVDECYHCSMPRCTYSLIENVLVENKYSQSDKTKKETVNVIPEDALIVFSNMVTDDIKIMGINPDMLHPRSLVMEYISVLPVRMRPYIYLDGVMCDDDLTIMYQTIVKQNNILLSKDSSLEDKSSLGDKSSLEDKTRAMKTLEFTVSAMFNNSHGRAKHNNGGRPIKGIKERISGKEGIIRNNIMGKRVNQSARTVIGPDPTLDTDQVALPIQIAEKLTVQERVSNTNIDSIQKIVSEHKANFVIRESGNPNSHSNQPTVPAVPVRINLKYAMSDGKQFTVAVGDIVERQLRNGDYVLINRQPTLHKCSMLAKRVVVRPGKTLRLNLATTKVFNADFDGDEMNVHVPQNYESISEMHNIMSSSRNIISSQSSKPNLCVVQDSLLGAYLMTRDCTPIPKHIFYDMCLDAKIDGDIPSLIKHIGGPLCGRMLVSMILPRDLDYTKRTDAVKDEPYFVVKNGCVVAGAITKAVIGSVHASLIQVIYMEYGNDAAMQFINRIQFAANAWLRHFGFSIGLGDCIIDSSVRKQIVETVNKVFIEAESIEVNNIDERIKESKVSMALARAKDAGMKIAKDAMSQSNGFVCTVTSGSKGDYFNICQIAGLLGQQNLYGKRISPSIFGDRTLPHYDISSSSSLSRSDFGSRGFVRGCFIEGLSPSELFFHSMSGREGVSDTALKTATSGYSQRKMIKMLEDLRVNYDGTVRNSSNQIVQWSYAGDGLDRTEMVFTNNGLSFCDVGRIVNKANKQFERTVAGNENIEVGEKKVEDKEDRKEDRLCVAIKKDGKRCTNKHIDSSSRKCGVHGKTK